MRKHLEHILAADPEIDTLVLGCTHYPLLSGVIGNILQDSVLVNSSIEAVLRIRDVLSERGLNAQPDRQPAGERGAFYVSDDTEGFAGNARRFLGRDITAELVDIDRY